METNKFGTNNCEMNNLKQIWEEIKTLLTNKKVENIKEFDLSNNNGKLSDICLIGSGTSSRHAQSVADSLYYFFKNKQIIPNITGNANSGWILVEAMGIEIHIFKPEVRKHYDLEELLSG